MKEERWSRQQMVEGAQGKAKARAKAQAKGEDRHQ